MSMAIEDGELLGNSWEHIFRVLTEVNRLHQVHELSSRNDRQNGDAMSVASSDVSEDTGLSDFDGDDAQTEIMDRKSIDEANAQIIYDLVPDSLVDCIYHRSSSLSAPAVKDFILQLCRVSRMEISGYGGHVGSRANQVVLDDVQFFQQHSLVPHNNPNGTGVNNQPVIYSLQKLVEVAHYNMESRPRLVFADLWATVAGHLTSTALHSNAAVAMYAVDTFRQLSIQFLHREELGVFEFQRRFLKPLQTVMARSEHVSTKELLLKCVERIILMFGSQDISGGKNSKKGMLRSGWRPVLAVLGIAGHDADEGIANMGFKMLDDQLTQCLATYNSKSENVTSLLTENFVDLVDAFVLFVAGKRMQLSLSSIDRLIELSNWLADNDVPLPVIRGRRKNSSTAAVPASISDELVPETSTNSTNIEGENLSGRSQELELWWPILLGLSQSIGDTRRAVREKALRALMDIINKHFFTVTKNDTHSTEEETSTHPDYDLQTLQLIFRGILIPILEHAETDTDAIANMYPLPDDFSHFVTHAPPPRPISYNDTAEMGAAYDDILVNDDDMDENGWIATTFDLLLDGCISICLKSMETYNSQALIEEVLAVLNSCLLSDSGALAVTGLRRLLKFITRDLSLDSITEDTWAVVCHMLKRCMFVRGLHSVMDAVERRDSTCSESEGEERKLEDQGLINEFIMEEDLFSGRRYICSNAAMVIGMLLCNETYAKRIGTRWFLFLMKGLGQGILDWENAADVVGLSAEDSQNQSISGASSPPHHLENAVYGRKWMGSLILLLARLYKGCDTETAIAKSRQSLLKEQTQAIVNVFIDKESKLGEKTCATSTEELILEACRAGEVGHMTNVVCELLEGYNKFDDDHLFDLAWLCPMLSALIQSNNRAVRVAVHSLVSRMFEGPLSNRVKGV